MSTLSVGTTVLFWLIHINKCAINPTSVIGNTQYYIASALTNNPNYFKSNDISCGTSICHITCDIANGCEDLTINSLSTNTLIMQCTDHLSCLRAIINADDTPNIDLLCNYTAAYGKQTGSCYYLTLNARHTQNAFIYSDWYNLGEANLYLTNADTVAGVFHGSSTYYTHIHIENVTNRVDIMCLGYQACHLLIWANDMKGDLNIQCIKSTSCWSTLVSASSMTGSLIMNCSGTCHNANIYCPVSCSISCAAWGGCQLATIYVKDEQFEQFSLDCSVDKLSCSFTEIECVSTGITATLELDACSNTFKCNKLECCPDQFKPDNCTYAPTLPPTLVTLPPSIPTSETLNPTLNPTLTRNVKTSTTIHVVGKASSINYSFSVWTLLYVMIIVC